VNDRCHHLTCHAAEISWGERGESHVGSGRQLVGVTLNVSEGAAATAEAFLLLVGLIRYDTQREGEASRRGMESAQSASQLQSGRARDWSSVLLLPLGSSCW